MRISLTETTPSDGEPGGIHEGGCSAWPLPPDETCAAVARSLIRETLATLGLGDDVIHDAATMVSELATNAFEHASLQDPLPPATPQYAVGGSELWLYRSADHLVCKVFDTVRCWKGATAPRSGEDPAEHGRGLGVVHVLSDGEWGSHLTRSRLGAWRVPGKAVYFKLPVPPAPRHDRPTSAAAAERLHLMLAARGIDRVYRAASDGQAVLSVRRGLTVRCDDAHFTWESASGDVVRRLTCDLIDVAEEIVRRHEELHRLG
jgi:hypothetical protein